MVDGRVSGWWGPEPAHKAEMKSGHGEAMTAATVYQNM